VDCQADGFCARARIFRTGKHAGEIACDALTKPAEACLGME